MKLIDIAGTKKREYLKAKINQLETIIQNKNIRELYRRIDYFKKGYQPRTNIVKESVCRLPQYFGKVEELFLSAIQHTWG
jgi:hypothetical protein